MKRARLQWRQGAASGELLYWGEMCVANVWNFGAYADAREGHGTRVLGKPFARFESRAAAKRAVKRAVLDSMERAITDAFHARERSRVPAWFKRMDRRKAAR